MNYESLINSINRSQIEPIYLFWGEEKLLALKALKMLKDYILDPELADLNYYCLDGKEVGIGDILAAVLSAPMFSERRLVVVEDFSAFSAGGKLGEQDERELLEYLQKPLLSTCLVFFLTGSPDMRKKMVKSLAKNSLVEFSSFKGKELKDWVLRRLKEENLILDEAALEYFLLSSERGLEFLENDICKLTAYSEPGVRITKSEIEKLIKPSIETKVFELIDIITSGKGAEAVRMMNSFLDQGEIHLIFLATLAGQLTKLIMIKEMKNEGLTEREIAGEIKQNPFFVSKLIKQARSYSVEKLVETLENLQGLDIKSKSVATPIRELYESFIIDLCYK